MNNSGVAAVTRNMMVAVASGTITSDELVVMLLYATSQMPGGDTIQEIATLLNKKPSTISKCLASLVERKAIGLVGGSIDLSPLYGFVPNEGISPKKREVSPSINKTPYQIWELANAIVPCPKNSSLGIISALLKTYSDEDILGCYADIARNPRNKRDGWINVNMKIVATWIGQWKAKKGQPESDPLAHLYQEG